MVGAGVLHQRAQQCLGIGRGVQQAHLPFAHEAAGHAGLQKAQQAVVVAGHIEQAQGLVVVAQLAPGPHFKQFFKRADAAGQGVRIEMALPREGAPIWSDVMAVARKAPNREEAHAFINYILRPDVIARISNRIGYPNPNKDAAKLLEAAPRPNPVMFMSPELRKTLFTLEPVGAPIERVRARIWRETKKPLSSEAAASACAAGELECVP